MREEELYYIKNLYQIRKVVKKFNVGDQKGKWKWNKW